MPVPDKSEVRMIDEIVLKVFMEGWYTCLAHGRNNLYQPMGNLVKALYGGNTRH